MSADIIPIRPPEKCERFWLLKRLFLCALLENESPVMKKVPLIKKETGGNTQLTVKELNTFLADCDRGVNCKQIMECAEKARTRAKGIIAVASVRLPMEFGAGFKHRPEDFPAKIEDGAKYRVQVIGDQIMSLRIN